MNNDPFLDIMVMVAYGFFGVLAFFAILIGYILWKTPIPKAMAVEKPSFALMALAEEMAQTGMKVGQKAQKL